MQPYNFGIHYDPTVGGYLESPNVKSGYTNQPDRFSYEWHFLATGGSTSDRNSFSRPTPTNVTNDIYIDMAPNVLDIGESQQLTIPSISLGNYVRLRIVKDRITGDVTCEIDVGDGNGVVSVDTLGFAGFIQAAVAMLASTSWVKLGLFRIEQDFGSGFQEYARYDANEVPAVGGGFVPRGDANAVPESANRVYDRLDETSYYDVEIADQTGTFIAVYDIESVNGEDAAPVIEIGSTDNTVVMSNAIDPDSVTLSDGNQTYVFNISTTDVTTTFDFPLASDDTVPKFGTDLTLSVIKGADTFTKTVTFKEPTGQTRVDLENPVELDESSLTFDTGLTPIATDTYFHIPTTDFSVSVNNVLAPVGDAPWQYSIWYLSGAGLRELTLASGYGAANINPVANAGPDQVDIVAGSQFTLDGSDSSDEDGTITSYQWLQTAGDPVTLADDTASITTGIAPSTPSDQTLSFRLTVADDKGDTNFDLVNIGVLAEVVPDIPPTASIQGGDASVNEGGIVSFTSDSIAGSSAITTYAWSATNGISVLNASAQTCSLNPTLAVGGTFTLSLTVTDENGLQDSTSITVAVNDITPPVITPNMPPLVDLPLGEPFFDLGAVVTDNVDPERTIYSDNIVDENVAGDYTLNYNTADEAGNVAATASITVRVAYVANPPTAIAFIPGRVFGGMEFTLDASKSENADSYQWIQLSGPDIQLGSPNGKTSTQTMPVIDEPTDISFRLTVTNADGGDTDDAHATARVKYQPRRTIKVYP